jgi:hypothetical protein
MIRNKSPDAFFYKKKKRSERKTKNYHVISIIIENVSRLGEVKASGAGRWSRDAI